LHCMYSLLRARVLKTVTQLALACSSTFPFLDSEDATLLPLPPFRPSPLSGLGSVSVGILFISYALHVHCHPFLDPSRVEDINEHHGSSFVARGVTIVYVRRASGGRAPGLRGTVALTLAPDLCTALCAVHDTLDASQNFKYNTLESLYLTTSLFILLAGALPGPALWLPAALGALQSVIGGWRVALLRLFAIAAGASCGEVLGLLRELPPPLRLP
jgi:hypothetical protein